MMRMMMTRCELRSGGGRGWKNFVNLLSSISFQWLILRTGNDGERITFSRIFSHAVSMLFSRQFSLVVIVITPDATRKTFQLTQSNRMSHCMEGIFRLYTNRFQWKSRWFPSTRDEDSLTERWFTHKFKCFQQFFIPWKAAEKKLQQQGKWWWFFFNALASSLLRALRNFQFLFCALSIQCRMANVAAWIKQIVYTLITTHSPG